MAEGASVIMGCINRKILRGYKEMKLTLHMKEMKLLLELWCLVLVSTFQKRILSTMYKYLHNINIFIFNSRGLLN